MSYAQYLPESERYTLAEAARNLLKDGHSPDTMCQVIFNTISDEAKGLEVCSNPNQPTGHFFDTIDFFTHLDDVILLKAVEAKPSRRGLREFSIWQEAAVGDVKLLFPIPNDFVYNTKDSGGKTTFGKPLGGTHFILPQSSALLFSLGDERVGVKHGSRCGLASVSQKTFNYYYDTTVIFGLSVELEVMATDVVYVASTRV